MPKVTTIPPRKQRNHAVASQETRKIRVQPIAVFPRIQRNRQPAIRHKLHIMRKSFTGIRNGSLLGSMPMTASVQPPQNIGNSFIR